MAWVYLLLAAAFEIAWPVGLKLSQTDGMRTLGIAVALVGMGLSGWLLWLAQREIPIGTAYAVWTGCGAAGTFAIGVLFFDDAVSMMRFLGVALIVGGVAVLKLAS